MTKQERKETEQTKAAPVPEFSRKVALSRLDGQVWASELEARPEERNALAVRFGLQSVDRLVASVEVHPRNVHGLIRVDGRFSADVVQTCIVTLDPVPAHVEEDFTAYFTDDPDYAQADDLEVEVAIEAADPPEPITGDAIDVGETAVQYFATALDPYPRCPDASIDALEAELGEDIRNNPFAVLARLKGRAE